MDKQQAAVALIKQIPQQMNNAAQGLTDYDFLQEVNGFIKDNPSGAAPQAVGPVWVKVVDKLPPEGKFVPVRGQNGRYAQGYTDTGIFNITGHFISPKDYSLYEWLDESGQQLFTREVTERMLLDLARDIRSQKVVTLQDVTEWFGTNYPIKTTTP